MIWIWTCDGVITTCNYTNIALKTECFPIFQLFNWTLDSDNYVQLHTNYYHSWSQFPHKAMFWNSNRSDLCFEIPMPFLSFDEWERPFLCNWINVGSSESIRYQSRYMAAKCIGNKLCSTDVQKYINTNCEKLIFSFVTIEVGWIISFEINYQSWVLHVLLLFRPP